MKAIILAGGKGTRLYPITAVMCKQLLPIYDKPMIYYPISVLMLAGIRDILLISTERDIPKFKELLGNGEQWGLSFSYAIQNEPRGLAEALIIGEDFLKGDDFAMILGDNIFYGNDLYAVLDSAKKEITEGGKEAVIFGSWVKNPQEYGVAEISKDERLISVEEKPVKPKSNWAITGLYFYKNSAVEVAKRIKPSARGELEITDVNSEFLNRSTLDIKLLRRGFAWLDTGTYENFLSAAQYIAAIEARQGLKISCVEEIAYRMNFISDDQLKKLARPLLKSGYGEYLMSILEEKKGLL